jgi:hypothetical protein
MSTEAITWHPVSEPPDSDITVMLFVPDATEPVWPGYLDGEAWRFIDGMPANPVSWAEMPVGAQK